MYDRVKLEETKSAIASLDDFYSSAMDLHETPSLFDTIASCILELENFEESKKEEAPSLYEVLKLLAEKSLISDEASKLANELEEFSEVTGYVEEIEEELDQANSLRSSLHELLNEYILEVEIKLS